MTSDLAPLERTGPTVTTGPARRWPLVVVILLLTVTLRLPAFFVDVFNSDETFLATQAQVIRNGGSLYENATDRKPPLVPYLYAATFALVGSTALWSIRMVAMLAVAMTALLLGAEGRRRWGEGAGWIAALLFVCASVMFAPQDGQAANFEVFMIPAMTAAVILAARDRPRGAGCAVALATLAKQTGAATLFPVLYLLWRHRGRKGVQQGVLAFVVPLAIVAVMVGPGDLLFWAVAGNGSYFGLGSATAYVAGLFAVMTLAFIACNLPILWSVPIAWRTRERGVDTDLWIWLASAALSVAVGLRFFGHYYLQLLPPLCLISASALVRMRAPFARATVAVAIVGGVGFTGIGFALRPFGDEPKYQGVSEYLKTRVRPKDSVFVWGHLPEIYWASGARPATRFLSSGFYLGDWGGRPPGNRTADVPTPGAQEMLMSDLRLQPPRFILDTTPASIRGSQYHPMSSVVPFDRFVKHGYRYVRTIDGIAVYRRHVSQRSAAAAIPARVARAD